MSHRILSLLLLLTMLVACAASEPDPPYDLSEPFLSTWRSQGGEARFGAPQSSPLWIDDYQTQFFAQATITAVSPQRAVADALEADWQAEYPADLLSLPVSPLRASLSLADSLNPTAYPLEPFQIELRIEDYSGPIELRLYDATLSPAGSVAAEVLAGEGVATIMPRGKLGPQWAIALVDGQIAGARRALFQLDAETALSTGQPDLDALYPRIREFMAHDRVSYELNGALVQGYRSPDNPLLWLRDHVYQGLGFRYFESDVTSLLDAFRDAQLPDGSFPDVLDYPELYVTAMRKEVEADLEFLFVQGVFEAWQMSGDDAWLAEQIPAMRKALGYITSSPLRWNAERGLVRRPYTIDMWDFSYGPSMLSPDGKPAPRHWINSDTVWGIFHGDNTGLAYAMQLMSRMERYLGNTSEADVWSEQSTELMGRLNALSWNGRFYTHVVLEDAEFQPAGVDPANQLSLSNAYALNRNVLDSRQGQAIISTYFQRRDFDNAFAEWYSINPPFPAGSYGMAGGKGENPGEYVNGGIMPLVGGELARGAFRYGSEPYGFDILRRYAALTELTGATYLWYYPDGRPGISSDNTLSTDGWGSSAMLGALFEGAAGVQDRASKFSDVILSPRWGADASFQQVRVVARYAASDGYLAYTWQRGERSIQLDLTGTTETAFVRILLPNDASSDVRLTLNGTPSDMTISLGGESRYASIGLAASDAQILVEW